MTKIVLGVGLTVVAIGISCYVLSKKSSTTYATITKLEAEANDYKKDGKD